MGRPKKAAITLDNIDACTWAMGELLTAVTDDEVLTAERDRAVAASSAMFETRIDAARVRRDELKAALEAYYYEHLQEIEARGEKHLQLVNGRFGRRLNPEKLVPLNRKWTQKAIAVMVRALLGADYFLPVKEPEIDKNALKAVDAEKLKACGLKVDADETFYVEPARLPAEAAK